MFLSHWVRDPCLFTFDCTIVLARFHSPGVTCSVIVASNDGMPAFYDLRLMHHAFPNTGSVDDTMQLSFQCAKQTGMQSAAKSRSICACCVPAIAAPPVWCRVHCGNGHAAVAGQHVELGVVILLILRNQRACIRSKNWRCCARVTLARLLWRAHVACIPRLRQRQSFLRMLLTQK